VNPGVRTKKRKSSLLGRYRCQRQLRSSHWLLFDFTGSFIRFGLESLFDFTGIRRIGMWIYDLNVPFFIAINVSSDRSTRKFLILEVTNMKVGTFALLACLERSRYYQRWNTLWPLKPCRDHCTWWQLRYPRA
jgi:hypothetical protein